MSKKNFAFVGLFGSGKSELAINYALHLREQNENVALVDADIISPYFRSRDLSDILERNGVKAIYPAGALKTSDLPVITGASMGYLSNPNFRTVLDVGGEESGVIVLGYLKPYLTDTEISLVVNIQRPFTSTVDGIIKTYHQLSAVARLKFDYLINNANLSYETNIDIVRKGEEILQKVSEILEIPVKYTVVPDFLNLNGTELKYPVFKIKRYLKMEL